MLPSSGPLSIGDIYNEVNGFYPSPGDNVSLNGLLIYFPQLSRLTPVPISRFYGASHGYTITWDFTRTSPLGSLTITAGGSTPVNVTSTSSGSFPASVSDNITISANGSTDGGDASIEVDLTVDDNGTTIYNTPQTGYQTASNSYGPYNITGAGSITVNVFQF